MPMEKKGWWLPSLFVQMRKVCFFTIGCKLNQYETQAISEGLEKLGFQRVNFGEKADLYLINTCTVTAQSDRSARQAVYRAKRFSPNAKIVAVGCYVQTDEEILRTLPGVSLVVKNENKEEILKKIARLFDVDGLIGNRVPLLSQIEVSGHTQHTRGLVKIQDGCNQACSYCIVPLARGSEKSRRLNSILSEIENLDKNSFKEVVLTGVHTGRYDFNGMNLCQLLEEILNRTKVRRLRLSSIEPKEITDELVDLVANNNRICRHFHIPLQSGDDYILSRMNRNYTTEDYAELVEKIIKEIPHALIGADVMVGFPEELESNFQNSLDFVLSQPINYLHVFSYSDRKGTVASKLPDKISPHIIKKRNEIFRELGYKKWHNFIEGFVGMKLEVVIEKRRDKKTGKLVGLSDNYIRVLVDGKDELMNQIVSVEIEKREERHLAGKLMN
jgi:threonylcarbamoyladenosine tRNA methylthiotransferase MtaB